MSVVKACTFDSSPRRLAFELGASGCGHRRWDDFLANRLGASSLTVMSASQETTVYQYCRIFALCK